MVHLRGLQSALRRRQGVPVAEVAEKESEKHTKETGSVRDSNDAHDGSDSDAISQEAQPGVQKMEATTKTWTKPWLIAAYVL